MLKENWTSKDQTIQTAQLMVVMREQMTEIQKDYCSVESLALMRAQKKVLTKAASLVLMKAQMMVIRKECYSVVKKVQLIK